MTGSGDSPALSRRRLLRSALLLGGGALAIPLLSACAAAAPAAPTTAPAKPAAAPTTAPAAAPTAAPAAAPTSAPAAAAAAKPTQAPAQPAAQKVTIRLGHVAPPGIPADLATKRFGEIAAERSKGSIEVQVSGNSALGGDPQILQSVQSGSIEMSLTGEGTVAQILPKYNWANVPFLLKSEQQYTKLLASPLSAELGNELQAKSGTRVLANFYRSARHLTHKSKAILKPDDAKGVKLRVAQVPLYTDAYRDIGFSVTPMNWGEVYSALQQGVVESVEAPLDFMDGSSIFEVQKSLMLTQHAYGVYVLLVNEKFFQGLSAEQKKALEDAADEATKVNLAESKKAEATLLESWKGKGVTVQDQSKIDAEAFSRLIVEKAIPRYEAAWGAGFYDQLSKAA